MADDPDKIAHMLQQVLRESEALRERNMLLIERIEALRLRIEQQQQRHAPPGSDNPSAGR